MALTETTTHVNEALARLLEQFKGKPRIEALLDLYVDQVQEIEVALYDVITETVLSTAIGTQLDNLGAVVNAERQGLSDADYRTVIRARIRVNLSSGTAADLIAITALLIPSTATIELIEYFPAELKIYVAGEGLQGTDPFIVAAYLGEGRAAGVRLVFEYIENDATDSFTMSDEGDYPTLSTATGYGSTLTGDGGEYAGAVET